MSRTATTLIVTLVGVVLFVMWVWSGDETMSTAENPGANAGRLASKSPFPMRQPPRSLLDRPEPRRDFEKPAQPEQGETEGDDEIVMRDRLDELPSSMANRQPKRRGQPQFGSGANPAQPREPGRAAGVVGAGQLSRRNEPEPEPEDTGKTEQPPLRAPLPEEPDDGVDEDSLDYLRDVALRHPDSDERIDAISELDLDDPAAMQGVGTGAAR